MSKELQAVLQRIDSIPALPQIVQRVQDLINDPNSSAAEITKEISKDPALTARLLKIVNSAFYGLSRRVATLTQAIVLLGFTQVRNIIIASAVKDMWQVKDPSRDRELLWKHCLGTALIAKEIARRIEYSQQEEVFIGGLLHDIGKILMDGFWHDRYEKVLVWVGENDCSFYHAEKEALGEYVHPQLGGLVARKWNLPPMLADIIQYHHQPSICGKNMVEVSIVHVANAISRIKEIGRGGDDLIPAIDPQAWDCLNLQEDGCLDLMRDIDTLMLNDVLLNETGLW